MLNNNTNYHNNLGLLFFKWLFFIPALLFIFNSPLLAGTEPEAASKKKPKAVQSEAGLNIPAWGIAIDAVYDPRLDKLIPGYKIINVVLTNKSAANLDLNPTKDKWVIRDQLGKTHQATNHLRIADEKIWLDLPQKLKELLEYPQTVRVGNSAKIDIFFSEKTELLNFREIIWKSAALKKEFNISTNMENNLDVTPKEKNLFKNETTYKQSLEKYEGGPPHETTEEEEPLPVTRPQVEVIIIPK